MKNDLTKPNIERLLTTMKGGIADRVPFYEISLEARNVEALLGKDVGTTMAASLGATADALYQPPMEAGDFARICHLTGMDCMTLESLWTPLKSKDDKGNLYNINDSSLNDWQSLEQCIQPNCELDFKPRKTDYILAEKTGS